jgi:glycosyltransferase involved in cell wall biosynthesis
LAAAGHEVTVLAQKTARSSFNEMMDGAKVIRIPSIFWNPRRLFVEKAIELDADVYHAHDLFALDIAFVAARVTGARLVYDSHELWYSRVKYNYRARLIRRLLYLVRERALIGDADRVIMVSSPTAELLKERYAVHDPVVIRNVPLPMAPLPSPVNLRDKLQIGGDKKILLHLGGIHKWRGFEQMLEVLARNEQLVLLAIGGGNQESAYERHCEEIAGRLRVRDRFNILKAMPFDEMMAHARGADVGMCLTQNINLHYYTTLSNKFFDYALAGLPIVASDFPVMRELVDKYHIGKLVDPADAKDIELKTAEILWNNETYQEMRRNCSRLIEENNWERESEKLLEIYDEIPVRHRHREARTDYQRKFRSILILGIDETSLDVPEMLKERFRPETMLAVYEGNTMPPAEDGLRWMRLRPLRQALRACRRKSPDAVITSYSAQGLSKLLLYDLLSVSLGMKQRFVYFPFIDLVYELDRNIFLRKFLNRFSTQCYFMRKTVPLKGSVKGLFI